MLRDHTEPQSDLAVLRPREDFYKTAHPGPDDVLLIIEVADTTLAYDRDIKLPLYARADIGEAVFILQCPDGPPALRESYGFGLSDVYRIKTALAAVLAELCNKWRTLHGDY